MKNHIIFIILISLSVFLSCHTHNLSLKKGNEDSHRQLIDSLLNESYQNRSNIIPDKYVEDALFIALKYNDDSSIFNIHVFTAKQFRSKSNYAKALERLQLAQNIALNLDNDELKANVIHEIAVVYRRLNDNANALKMHTKALGIAENIQDTFLIHCSLNGIGNVYFNYKEWEKAIDYFHQSLNYLGTKEPNLLGEAINTNTIGESWLGLGETDSALHYLERSLRINFFIKSQLGQAICFNGIGTVYNEMKDYENAKKAYKSALEIYDKLGDLFYETMCLNNLANTYYLAGETEKAESTYLRSYELASGIGTKSHAMEAAIGLSELYFHINKPKNSYLFQQKAMAYKDSITEELRTQNSETMKVLYETEKQKREILVLKQDAKLNELKLSRQKYVFLSLAILLVIIIAFTLFIYRQRQLQGKITAIGLEQKLLRAQLNPHFIFNSLSAIQNFIMKNDKIAASEYLVNFSRLMRNILIGSSTELISLSDEIEILDDYLTLQRLRYLEKFDYFFEIDNEIEVENCQVPPMLLQPFVENSIEHGVRDIDYQGVITIRFMIKNDYLIFEIEDNGKGVSEKQNDNKNGNGHVSMAIKIIQQRISNIESTYKKKCTFQILDKTDQNDKGVLIRIEFPFISEI